MLRLYIICSIVLLVHALVWFIVSLIKKRNDVADTAWGLGFIIVALTTLFAGIYSDRLGIIFYCILIWGIRLVIYLSARNKRKQEDFRYKAWREQWGRFVIIRSFLQVYLLQSFLLLVVVFPVILIGSFEQAPLTALDLIGLTVWLAGLLIESVSDYQMSRFKKNPEHKGKIIMTGLWKYSRHPNYFGEILLWWGIGIIACSGPFGMIGLIGPLTLHLLIVYVSGIPILEARYRNHPDFEDYKKKTSKLILRKQTTNY